MRNSSAISAMKKVPAKPDQPSSWNTPASTMEMASQLSVPSTMRLMRTNL